MLVRYENILRFHIATYYDSNHLLPSVHCMARTDRGHAYVWQNNHGGLRILLVLVGKANLHTYR